MSLSSDGTVMTMPVQPANNYNGGMGMWGQDWFYSAVYATCCSGLNRFFK